MLNSIRTLHRFARRLFAGAALLCVASTAQSIDLPSPTPGTVIDNQAQVIYLFQNGNEEIVSVSLSNVATVRTGADYGLDLTKDLKRDTVATQTIQLPHVISHLGNAPDTFRIEVTNLPDDAADLEDIKVYLDVNGNGVPDSGESDITNGTTTTFAPGDLISVVIQGQVPASVNAGDLILLDIRANSVSDPTQFDINRDTIRVVDGALIRIAKTSSQACNIPVLGGDELTYSMEFPNSGFRAPLNREHNLEGETIERVLLVDQLPADVTLIHGQTLSFVPFRAIPVVLLEGDVTANKWTRYANWDGTRKAVRIGLMFDGADLQPASSGAFSFRVRVNTSVTQNTRLINRAFIDETGDGEPDHISGDVCNTTGGPRAQIRFLSPTFDNIRNKVAPTFEQDTDFSDTLRYRFDAQLQDYDATFDGVYVELDSTSIPEDNLQYVDDGRRQVVVNVTSKLSGQTIPVLVRETAVGTGKYRSVYPIVLSTNQSGTGNLCGDLTGDVNYLDEPPQACTLLSGEDDDLIATFFDRGLGEVIDDASIVDPLGFVFNSYDTDIRIQGAKVRIYNAIDNGPGGRACELANDPFEAPGTPLEIEITDATGFYQYPFMFSGSYFMTVRLPTGSGYSWPSRRDPRLYPNLDVSDFSYGFQGFGTNPETCDPANPPGANAPGVFTLDEQNPIVSVDFPVDPVLIDLAIGGDVQCDANLNTDDPILYSTNFQNSGNLTPPERQVFVDGVQRSGVVIEAQVPLNTLLDPDVVPSFTTSGTQARVILKPYDGSAEDRWISYDSWIALDPSARPFIQRIGLLVPATDLEPSADVTLPGEGGTLSFGVLVSSTSTQATQIVNRMGVDLDGDGNYDIQGPEDFQNACATAATDEPSIRFVRPDNGGNAPEFAVDAHFVDTEIYALDGLAENYSFTLDGAYIELRSTSMNREDFELLDDGRRRVVVRVASSLTGDFTDKVLEETQYASGLFRSLAPLVIHADKKSKNLACEPSGSVADYLSDPPEECYLNAQPNDVITVTFLHRFEDSSGAADVTLEDVAYISPIAYVFYSQAPYEGVPNALVRFYDANSMPPGSQDPSRAAAGPFVTEEDGSFPFPLLEAGRYYVHVESTDTFKFPSDVSFDELDAFSGYQVSEASFGYEDGQSIGLVSKPFDVASGSSYSVPFDIPVDPLLGSANLVVEKTALQNRVEIGGLVEYSVSVTNVGDGLASDVVIADDLPFGFKYIEGTTRRGQTPDADPAGVPAPTLTFNVGDLPAGDSVSFNYVLQATSGAIDSNGINTAQASGTDGPDPIQSNPARAKVEIELTGVLSERGIIFGKIFVDQDCNAIQSQGEWPIGGVALYLEDGTYAVTDENGQYSMYGVRPGDHVIKVDPLTMPEGLRLKPIDNRNLARPDSRLIDLQNGEFHRADFAVACPSPDQAEFVYAQVQARNESIQGDWLNQNSASFDPLARAQASAALNDGDLSSGSLLSASQLSSANTQFSPSIGLSSEIDYTATSEEEVEQAVLVEEVIHQITQEEGREGRWLWPLDNTSLYGRFVVAVRDRIQADLFVNGVAISRDQIGEQAHNSVTDVQVIAWYGIRLEPGENLIEVKAQDMFGNERVLLSKTFVSPSHAVELGIRSDQSVLAADGGRSTLPIEIYALDENGNNARGVYFVTLETTDGRFVEEDLQPINPGHQIRLDRGSKVVHLASSHQTGEVRVRASTDAFEAELVFDQVAAQRSLLVSGVASASAGYCDLNSEGYGPAVDCDDLSFEERAALFMKGSVRGNLFLTLSYDSDKAGDAELLRDIDPSEYYPIFGDSSVRGYEAQSRSKLYAKLEMDTSFVEWGDFSTDRNSNFQDLGRVQRALTGVNAQYEQGDLSVEAFAAEVEDTRVTVEIPGNGTAMLYRLPQSPIVRNSEVVELIVRDRDNRGLVIESQNLTRNLDYSLDPVTGNLRFNRVIPTLDSDLNPMFLRISFDVEGNGGSDLVAGVRASYELVEDIVVGGSYTRDENSTQGYDIGSAFVEMTPSENARIFISGARMEHQDASLEAGNALYAELEMSWTEGSRSLITLGRADAGFTNGSVIAAGSEEVRMSHTQDLTAQLSLTADLVASETLGTGDVRNSMEVGLDYEVGAWTLSLGGRRIEQTNAGQGEDATTLIAGAGRGFTLLGRRGDLDIELEREVGQLDRKRWFVGGSWQVHEKVDAYVNLEQVNSLTGPASLAVGQEQITANLGFESDFLPSTTIYNEYRMRGVIDGRDLESSTGIRGDYEIAEGIRINPSIEWIDVLEGDTGKDGLAISLGIEDLRNDNARNLSRIEARFDDSQQYYGLDWSYVARVSLDWSSFVREQLAYTLVEGADNTLQHELTIGLTRRPRETNQYHALYMYQWTEERSGGLLGDRTVHLLSTHQNYQFNDDLRLSGRVGAKWESTPLLNADFSSLTAVMDARLIWDITRRFDLDIHAGTLGTNSFEETRYSLGAGINFLVTHGLRVGVGYNLIGFEEGDLDSEGFNQQGFYINAEYTFDENLFRWLESDLNRRREED